MRISDWSSDVCSSDLGDVAGVAAHHLQHHDPRVAGRRRLELVERLGRHLHCRCVAERDLGMAKVVVDGLGDGDEVDAALLGQTAQDGLAAVAADADKGIELQPPVARSEEHTSELQSLMRISYAVFCLYNKN